MQIDLKLNLDETESANEYLRTKIIDLEKKVEDLSNENYRLKVRIQIKIEKLSCPELCSHFILYKIPSRRKGGTKTDLNQF